MSDISVDGASRNLHFQLKNIRELSERTQLRLTSGRRVNSVADDAVAYFRARGLNDRADNLEKSKTYINEALSLAKLSYGAVEAVDGLLANLRNLASAREKSLVPSDQAELDTAIANIGQQINTVLNDATFGGANLLNSNSNSYSFSFSNTSTINLSAVDLVSNLSATNLKTTASVDSAIDLLRAQTSRLGYIQSNIEVRLDFSKAYTDELRNTADTFINADLVEEAARLSALQTQESLGFQSISLANQQRRELLSIFQ